MQSFDLIVIGAGSGLNVSSSAADMGMKVAVVEKGPMGGTCLNRGCIPSKIIIHSADVAETIKKSKLFGINSKISSIDFRKITGRASGIVDKEAKEIEEAIKNDKNTTLFKTEAKFISERTLKVGNGTISGEKVIIAAGTRPLIPDIEGLKNVDFVTSDEALRLKKQPKTMTILGGGYIAAELAHFYGSLGTKVNIIQKRRLLIPNEDKEIAEKFTEIFRKKYNVLTECNATKISKKGNKFIVNAASKNSNKKLVSDALLVAVGRIPNTDILDVKKANVEIDDKGFIKTNDYLETTAKNTWALGDIAGKYLFKHSANLEAQYVYNNIVLNEKLKVDYTAMPHAIFSSPQIAGVGLREQDLKQKSIDYAAGRYDYIDSGMGIALQDNNGFVKIFADRKTRKILGCHIMGTDASTLIHEVLVAMKANLNADSISNAVHIHPALSEVVQRAVRNIEW
ncbi:dihydrolipoyl dehydrogenase [Candidatus Woesearchaeota archaeon]|nr:dihydrolipoyl dehydrogenase [Candidatus Woesearchaeota archaeon]